MSGRGVCIYPDSPEQARQLMAQWSPTHAVAVFPRPGSGIGRPPGCRLFRPRPRVGDYRAAAEATLRAACPGVCSVEHHPAPVPVDTSVRRVESIGDLEGGPGRELGFVAVHFNPCGYAKPRENFKRFLKNWSWMGDRLLVVELAFGEQPFEMSGLAENLLQLRGDSVMWQKEALINAGTRILRSRGYENVGWLDGDLELLLDGERWYGEVCRLLRRCRAVQVFESLRHQFADDSVRSYGAVARSAMTQTPTRKIYKGGGGWAVRGALWDAVQWYDRMVVGGGDSLLFLASVGALDVLATKSYFADNAAYLEHARAWAAAWHGLVDGDTGWVAADVDIMAHGPRSCRQYDTRAGILIRHGYAPETFVRTAPNGVLEWTAAAPQAMRREIVEYFRGRREDD